MKMKRNLPVILFLLFSIWAGAQTIAIDDPAFEDALIALGHDSNPVRDGVISIVDADMVTDLNVSNRGISDLSGLEFFSAVETLDVSGNDLDELVLQNLSLVTIKADNCNLAGKAIFFKNEAADAFLTNVIDLSLNDNGISGNSNGIISFGGVENVRFLSIRGNNIEAVNLKNTSKIELLDADNCPNLSVLNDLDGLQNLKGLILSDCSFTSLDVMDNAALESLVVSNNSIAEIVVNQNPALAIFRGSNNAFTALDFSGNNALTAVDVSSNTQLSTLNVANGNNAALTALNAQATALSCIQVDNPGQAENAPGWEKDATAVYAGNCNALNNVVEVFFESPHTIEEGFYIFDSKIELGFNLRDKNGIELPSSTLASYEVILNTEENNNLNPATKGVDFEALTNQPLAITTIDMGIDRKRELEPKGDQLFEADEYFFIDISTNDPNISLKNAVNGVVRFPVRIIDNENTEINLQLVRNGAEPSQSARLRITSTLANDTGAPMPFSITLNDGSATQNEDYQNTTPLPVIAVGESSVEFDIGILNNDIEPENEENFFAAVSYAGTIDPSRVIISNGNQEVLITDDGDVNTQPFEVSTSLLGAGISPDYQINEGETFTLDFNAGATADNGDSYNPEISFSLNGANTIEDFLINGEASIPNVNFTVIESNPDGIITIQAKTDDFLEQDEVYTITINSRDNTKYTIDEPSSFTVTIKDVPPSEPFLVTPYLSIPATQSGYSIEEGKSFRIYFESDNSQYYDDQSFDVFFNSADSSAEFDVDYYHEGSPTSFITRYRQDAEEFLEVETFIHPGENENKEIVIILQKDPDGLYTWENESADGSFEFRVNIEDKPKVTSDPFEIETILSDNVISVGNNNYTIAENETIVLGLNALAPSTESYLYEISYSIEGTTASAADYFLQDSSPKEFIVQTSTDPDGTLEFSINPDEFSDNDKDEKLVINLLPDPNGIYSWGGENVDEDGVLSFEFTIIDIPPFVSNNIEVEFNNSGGIEGGYETFTVKLYDSQGNPWSDHDGLEFSLDFKNEIFDLDTQNAISDSGLKGQVATSDDYKNEDNTALDENPKIIIAPKETGGSFKVYYPPESDVNDDYRDYYSVEISSVDSKFYFDIEKIQAIILDNAETAQFYINISPGENLSVIPNPTNGENYDPKCCLQFSVEEGEEFNIRLEAEKGVPLLDANGNVNKTYQVKFSLGGDANFDDDFEYDNTGTTISNTDGTGINDLIIDVKNDDNSNERINNNIGETLEIDFESLSSQFFINNSYFDLIPSEEEGELERYLIRKKFKIQIVDVLKVKEFKASEIMNVAKESPLANAEFKIDLEADNSSGKEMRINYEVIMTGPNSATPIADYTTDNYDQSRNRGYVTIPNGERSTKITVQPVNDTKFEPDENVVIRLIEGSKYSINNLSSQQIIIESEDTADYTATLKQGDDNQSREADPNDFAEIIIELDQTPIADIEVEFKVSNQTDFENVIEGIGQDYLIYQEDKETIIPENNRKVIFKANNDKLKKIYIKALPDGEDENNESVFLELDSGVNYRPIPTADAEVILVSSTSDLSNFDPTSITIVARNPRCPGENQRGSIFMSNGSPFPFSVNIKGLDGSNYDTMAPLDKNDSEDFTQIFDELPIGNYEIILSFSTDDKPDNAFPPSYTVQITAIPEMSAEEQSVNLETRLGRFEVAGSETYTVEANGKTYLYQFGNPSENVIEVPLDHGLNSIQISGDAACLGIIKKELLLNRVFIYPNPAQKFVSIISDTLLSQYKLHLFDMNGRLVHLEESTKNTNQIILDVSQLQKGLYLGRITTVENDDIEFKLVKN